MALVACGLIQNGAQLFAVSIIARTVSKAPPRSFAIFTGEYPYDSRAFWDTVPMITMVLFVIALIANWNTARRKFLLLTLALFIVGGLIAGLYLEPTFDAMIARGYADYVDPVMPVLKDRKAAENAAAGLPAVLRCGDRYVELAWEKPGLGTSAKKNKIRHNIAVNDVLP